MRLVPAAVLIALVLVGCSKGGQPRSGSNSDTSPPASRLMLAPASVKQACQHVSRRVARQSRWRVVCPPLIPKSKRPEVTYAGGVLSSSNFGPGYLLEGRDAAGASVYAGHWTLRAAALLLLATW